MAESGVNELAQSPESFLANLRVPPLLIVVSAPSGSGKSTICRRLVDSSPGEDSSGGDIVTSVSTTTREPRGHERDGVDYHFVDDETFDQMIERGEFLEWARVHGERYGTSRSALREALESNRDVVLEIDVQGGRQVREACPGAVLVFIAPPSLEELERRLRDRGTESPRQIQRRLRDAREELMSIPHYDYLVINDEVEVAVDKVRSIRRAEKSRLSRLTSEDSLSDSPPD